MYFSWGRKSALAVVFAALAIPVGAQTVPDQNEEGWHAYRGAIGTDGSDFCVARTRSDGTEFLLLLASGETGGWRLQIMFRNAGWGIEPKTVRFKTDLRRTTWRHTGDGHGNVVVSRWGEQEFGDEPQMREFLEDIASQRTATLTRADDSVIAEFSLKGSRAAVDALKACAEVQTITSVVRYGQDLVDPFE